MVALICIVPEEMVVLEAARLALNPAAPAGEAKLTSTASERPPAASFLQKEPRPRLGLGCLASRMAFIGRPGR